MRKNLFYSMIGVVVFGLLGGCWQPEYADQEYIDAVPTTETLKIKLPEEEASPVPVLMTDVGDLAEFYVMTYRSTRDINHGIYNILHWVHTILEYPVSGRDGDTYTWGPWRGDSGLDPVEYKFTMGKADEPDTFDFTFHVRDHRSESEDDWMPLIDGNVLKGSRPHHGVGTLDLWFSNGHALDPVAHPETGRLEITFDTVNDPHHVLVELVDFEGESEGDTANGEYEYHEYADLSGDFRFTATGNVIDESPAIESLEIRTRWLPSGAGLAEASVSGGDLATLDWDGVTMTECWDEYYQRSFYEDQITSTEPPQHLNPSQGDAAACPVFDADPGIM